MEANTFDHLPQELVKHVSIGCGERGVDWLHALPEVIRHLESKWAVIVDEPFSGVEYNFVAPATTIEGEPVVVKIHPPWDPIEIFDEAAYLRARDGHACVRLLAEDKPSRAILLERLFPGQTLTELFKESKSNAISPAVATLRAVSMPASRAPANAPTVDDWFKTFDRFPETDFPKHYAEKAFAIYNELSGQTERIFYIHGDFHPGNVVDSDRCPYLVIDPKGIVGHLGYEIAAFLNNFNWWHEGEDDLKPVLWDAVEQFSGAFGIPQIELRRWAYAQMVIGAWWNYADMPELYDGSVVKADIWDV
jgi:streptomycin 6-kinase